MLPCLYDRCMLVYRSGCIIIKRFQLFSPAGTNIGKLLKFLLLQLLDRQWYLDQDCFSHPTLEISTVVTTSTSSLLIWWVAHGINIDLEYQLVDLYRSWKAISVKHLNFDQWPACWMLLWRKIILVGQQISVCIAVVLIMNIQCGFQIISMVIWYRYFGVLKIKIYANQFSGQ